MRKRDVALVIVALLMIMGAAGVAGWHVGYVGLSLPFFGGANSIGRSDVDHTFNLIQAYGSESGSETAANAIRGMITGLNDPHSFYVPRDIYQAFLAEGRGDLFDVGLVFAREGDALAVLDVQSGSPGASAGIMPGDSILAINGVAVASVHQPLALTTMLFGKPGERVTLAVRTKTGVQRDVVITHTAYTTPTAIFKMLENGVGYLKIYSFDPPLTADFAAIESTLRNDGTKKLVIDLRNNPGGDVDTTVGILNKFIDQGTLFSERIGLSKPVTYHSAGNAVFKDVKLAVLVNGFTASAAELFAVAAQEDHRGMLVGATTTGKATEQSYFELGDGSAIHITDGRWFAPNGEWTDGKGVAPDVQVSDDGGAVDKSLQTAIELLQNI